MVHSFLIHTVCPVSALSAAESRVLYSRVFGAGEGLELRPDERRLLHTEKLLAVARQVRSAVALSRDASGRVLVETVPGEEVVALQEADSGVLRLRAGEPFPGEMSVLWLGVQSLGFTLVCEPHENLLLAEGTLRNLTRHCLEHLHMLGPGSEVSQDLRKKRHHHTQRTQSQSEERSIIFQQVVTQPLGNLLPTLHGDYVPAGTGPSPAQMCAIQRCAREGNAHLLSHDPAPLKRRCSPP